MFYGGCLIAGAQNPSFCRIFAEPRAENLVFYGVFLIACGSNPELYGELADPISAHSLFCEVFALPKLLLPVETEQ